MHTQHIAQQIAQLLANSSTTFASVAYTTQVKTAAAHKHLNVQKHTVANVQLFANVSAFANVYTNAVQKSAAQHTTNNAAAVANFTAQQNYYTHTSCYSIVQHNTNANALYLYARFLRARSTYTINNVAATKQQVAALLTASAAAQLLQANNVVYNATHNITHNVHIRTIALSNIKRIRAMRTQLQF